MGLLRKVTSAVVFDDPAELIDDKNVEKGVKTAGRGVGGIFASRKEKKEAKNEKEQ